mmetsp:Transcript_78408/g.221717  ORF Transcript_78408/g.221717 Transcript_78408/m.221717 type:complete len:238 (-) Transcript_78408:81-794(-)
MRHQLVRQEAQREHVRLEAAFGRHRAHLWSCVPRRRLGGELPGVGAAVGEGAVDELPPLHPADRVAEAAQEPLALRVNEDTDGRDAQVNSLGILMEKLEGLRNVKDATLHLQGCKLMAVVIEQLRHCAHNRFCRKGQGAALLDQGLDNAQDVRVPQALQAGGILSQDLKDLLLGVLRIPIDDLLLKEKYGQLVIWLLLEVCTVESPLEFGAVVARFLLDVVLGEDLVSHVLRVPPSP